MQPLGLIGVVFGVIFFLIGNYIEGTYSDKISEIDNYYDKIEQLESELVDCNEDKQCETTVKDTIKNQRHTLNIAENYLNMRDSFHMVAIGSVILGGFVFFKA